LLLQWILLLRLLLGSACSHRPVFKALALFNRAPVVDSSVQMIDSNGNTTTAAGICSGTLRLHTVNPAGTVAINFGEVVYNPECPVNLLSVANTIMDREGKARDNEGAPQLEGPSACSDLED
jgi:hypothetical protein